MVSPEAEKPYIPDVHANEGFKKRMEKLTSGEQFRMDPSRATVKEDATLSRRVESTMLTKFEHSELKALPAASFPVVTPRERGPMLASLEVIQQLEYKATEKKYEENTFTNIDFGREAAPETLEEAEEMFMGRWDEADTPAQKERAHRLQVQREKAEYAEAVQHAIEKDKGKPAALEDPFFEPAPLPSQGALPSTIRLVRKKKRAEDPEKAGKRPKLPAKALGALGLVEY